jgi:hypothetical protein
MRSSEHQQHLDINRLVALHNATHHNVGLGPAAKTRDGKALWQPLARKGLIDQGSAQFCGVLSITRKGRELLQQPHSEIAKALGIEASKVAEVLAMPVEER